jgi:hypothetical protein
MKKFSFISSVLLLVVVIAFLFIGCQKESAVTEEGVSTSENASIKAIARNGSFEGSIDGSYAASLQQNFTKEYDADNQTLRVAFSAKNLAAFIGSLQTKYKSDIIYVNFGVYGKGAPAPNAKDNGRMTVFFTGNNMPGSNGNVKTNGADGQSDEYLNHGGLLP